MKWLSKTLIILLSGLCLISKAQLPQDFKKIEVPRYAFKPTKEFKLLTIPVSFGSSQLSYPALADSLKNKKINSVRLVYTQYHESQMFDQDKLNRERVDALLATNPSAFGDTGIKWYHVEQTLKDPVIAKTLFTGFYILYKDITPEIDYAVSHKLLNTDVLETQTFEIKNNKDTLISGKEGTEISIRSNCFFDENNKPYKGSLKIELKEAVTMESIILGNLLTMCDGNALESGGMIYIDAKTPQGKSLSLNPKKPLEISVPSKEINPQMKLWQGEENGKFINWKNPVPLSNNEPGKAGKDTFISVFDFNDVNPVVEMARHRLSYKDIKHIDYEYILYSNGKVRSSFYNITSKKGKSVETMVADTFYNALNIHNKNITLPVPSAFKAYVSRPVYFKNSTLKYEAEIAQKSPAVPLQTVKGIFESYNFRLPAIGKWTNIDALIIDPRDIIPKKEIIGSVVLEDSKSYGDICIYLIFKDKKTYIPAYKPLLKSAYLFDCASYAKTSFSTDSSATVLCIAYKDNTPYYSLEEINISEKQELLIKLNKSSAEVIKTLIANSF